MWTECTPKRLANKQCTPVYVYNEPVRIKGEMATSSVGCEVVRAWFTIRVLRRSKSHLQSELSSQSLHKTYQMNEARE